MSDYTVSLTGHGWRTCIAILRRQGKFAEAVETEALWAKVTKREADEAAAVQRAAEQQAQREVAAKAEFRSLTLAERKKFRRKQDRVVRLSQVAPMLATQGWGRVTRARVYVLATSGACLFRQTATGRWYTSFATLPAIAAELGLAQVIS